MRCWFLYISTVHFLLNSQATATSVNGVPDYNNKDLQAIEKSLKFALNTLSKAMKDCTACSLKEQSRTEVMNEYNTLLVNSKNIKESVTDAAKNQLAVYQPANQLTVPIGDNFKQMCEKGTKYYLTRNQLIKKNDLEANKYTCPLHFTFKKSLNKNNENKQKIMNDEKVPMQVLSSEKSGWQDFDLETSEKSTIKDSKQKAKKEKLKKLREAFKRELKQYILKNPILCQPSSRSISTNSTKTTSVTKKSSNSIQHSKCGFSSGIFTSFPDMEQIKICFLKPFYKTRKAYRNILYSYLMYNCFNRSCSPQNQLNWQVKEETSSCTVTVQFVSAFLGTFVLLKALRGIKYLMMQQSGELVCKRRN